MGNVSCTLDEAGPKWMLGNERFIVSDHRDLPSGADTDRPAFWGKRFRAILYQPSVERRSCSRRRFYNPFARHPKTGNILGHLCRPPTGEQPAHPVAFLASRASPASSPCTRGKRVLNCSSESFAQMIRIHLRSARIMLYPTVSQTGQQVVANGCFAMAAQFQSITVSEQFLLRGSPPGKNKKMARDLSSLAQSSSAIRPRCKRRQISGCSGTTKGQTGRASANWRQHTSDAFISRSFWQAAGVSVSGTAHYRPCMGRVAIDVHARPELM